MTHGRPARTAARDVRSRRGGVAGLVAVIAVGAAGLGYPFPASSPSTTASSSTATSTLGVLRAARLRSEGPRALGEADGALPGGSTLFDETPGVTNLEPALLGALRRAAIDAADDGVELTVESGWRSREYQEHLFREAVSKYGSEAEAARWVATPDTSAHVSGGAVDIGSSDAAAWLSAHGARYGLCQTYDNEPWHYELRPEAVDRRCPTPYADASHDPRSRRAPRTPVLRPPAGRGPP